MKQLKSIFVCAAAWLTLGTASAAVATDASIEELLQVTRVQSISEDIDARVEQNLRATLVQAAAKEKLTAEQQRGLEQYVVKAAALVREETNWSKMKPEIVRIYREALTQEDIEGMLAFYRTPAGQAVIKKLPQVTQKTMEFAQRRMSELMPKLQAILQEALTQAKATQK
jgi:hypothetical protein